MFKHGEATDFATGTSFAPASNKAKRNKTKQSSFFTSFPSLVATFATYTSGFEQGILVLAHGQ